MSEESDPPDEDPKENGRVRLPEVVILATEGGVVWWYQIPGIIYFSPYTADVASRWLRENSEATHVLLGIAGSTEIPVLSQLADLGDGLLSLSEGDGTGALMSAGGIFIQGLSQTKLARNAVKAGAKALAHNANQKALKELVKEVTQNGKNAISVSDAKLIRDFAKEVNYPGVRASMVDLAKQSNHWVGALTYIFQALGVDTLK